MGYFLANGLVGVGQVVTVIQASNTRWSEPGKALWPIPSAEAWAG